jgi:hypothetical protein
METMLACFAFLLMIAMFDVLYYYREIYLVPPIEFIWWNVVIPVKDFLVK